MQFAKSILGVLTAVPMSERVAAQGIGVRFQPERGDSIQPSAFTNQPQAGDLLYILRPHGIA